MSVSWSPNYFYDIETVKYLFARYVAPVVIAFIALNLFVSENEYQKAIRYLLVAALLLALLSVFQIIFGFQGLFQPRDAYESFRASGTFQNPNSLAIFLVLTMPHLLYGINRKILPKKMGWAGIMIITAGIVCTVSRKGIVTAWIVLFLFFVLTKQLKKIMLLFVVTIIATSVFSGYMLVSQRFTEKKIKTQITGKYTMTIAGVDMFLKNPIIGHGYQGYSENYGKYFRRRYFTDPTKYDAHNIFITVLVNYGLLGFVPFMFIFIYPLYISLRTIKKGSSKYSKDMSFLCIISIIPFIMNGFYAGGLLDQWPIMMLFYINVVLLFSLTRNDNNNCVVTKYTKQ
jgi:O-antigen ligase